jgi:hypothetical protein
MRMSRLQQLAASNTTSKAEPPNNQSHIQSVVRAIITFARITSVKNKAAPAVFAFRGLQ